MAEVLVSAATGAMGSLLEMLGTMLTSEYELLKNVREDIESLKAELEVMHIFLVRMANVEKPDEQAKHRVDAVREMSYEIEDKIDEFMIHVKREPTSKYNGFMKIFVEKIKDYKIRREIAKDVKDIKSQVKKIDETFKRYEIEESSSPRNKKVDPRVWTFYKDASELVGIDGPRDELVKWVNNKEGELGHRPKVLSIVGYGGLGKTTLAKQVYDKLKAKYDCRAFVSISRSPDMTQILSSILCELRNQDYAHGGPDTHRIIDQIRDILKDRRYFIVIDDIWDVQTWKNLECALFKNGYDSVIMTTTRIHDVAKSCCYQGNLVYKIQPLDVPDSKRLFFKRIFGSEEKCPSKLKEIAEDILKKCGGLPLAINAISSLLATGKTIEEWNHLRGSIGFAQGKHSEIDSMNYILFLSYFDLPLHLRSCLLYLAMFPEDCKIERQRLVLLWISEGFIHGEDEKDLLELGDMHFYELVNRSLIQPVDIGGDGKTNWCRVHDIVLDFLIFKSTEENFCTLLSKTSKPSKSVRRLSLIGNEDHGSIEHLDLSHARSLIAFTGGKLLPPLAKSNALRVLDLRHCYKLGNHNVEGICRLFRLRYLNISGTDISELPRQIGNLECLETLDVCQTKLSELPESVTRLQRLACLSVDAETKFPDGIGKLKNLQVLWAINPLKQSLNFVEELGKLTNLKKLSITWGSRGSSDKTSFKEEHVVLFFSSLRKLETCKLATTNIDMYLTEDDASLIRHALFPDLTSIRQILIKRGQFCWISEWFVSLVNLEKLLTSFDDVIEQQDIEKIGSIPTLLELYIRSTIPWPIVSSSTGFERLHTLHVRNEFVFEAGGMPNLKNLVLNLNLNEFKSAARGGDCAGGFISGIHHLSSLARLHVDIDCSGARAADVEAAEGALKSMADAHPNRPTLEIEREYTEEMIDNDEDSDEMPQDDEDSGEQNDKDSDGNVQENRTIFFPKQTERKRKRE